MKDVYEMKLHEQIAINNERDGVIGVLRVPGGWIYSIILKGRGSEGLNSVFVPYADSGRFIKNGNVDKIIKLKEEIAIDERLLKRYDTLLTIIPECPRHGGGCIPHASEWIENAKARLSEISDE